MSLIYKGSNKILSHEEVEKMRQMIENDDDDRSGSSTSLNFSYKLDKYLKTSGIGDILDIINCVLSFIEMIFYITSTYTYNSKDISVNDIIVTIEIFICLYFIIHYILRLYIAQNRLAFIFSPETFIDLITIIPIVMSQQNFQIDILYYLRLL